MVLSANMATSRSKASSQARLYEKGVKRLRSFRTE
jgi:hypothetical protein